MKRSIYSEKVGTSACATRSFSQLACSVHIPWIHCIAFFPLSCPTKMSGVDKSYEALLHSGPDSDLLGFNNPLSLSHLLLSATLLTLPYILIESQPDCDQPLILWTWVFISLELATFVWKSLKCCIHVDSEVVSWSGYMIGGMILFLWLYGHFPVYSSEVCDESLWYFVFIIVTLMDVVLGVVVILLCGSLACGVRLGTS